MSRPAPTFYVFHGADELARTETVANFRTRLGASDMADLNTTFLDGKKISLAELRHVCDAVPFLAEKRLVIVNGLLTRAAKQESLLQDLITYLLALPQTTRLVFVEEKALSGHHPILKLAQEDKKGYVKQFDLPSDKMLPRWIKERVQRHGGDIEPQAAVQLATVVGANLRVLDQEITKLVTYVNAERAITKSDVDEVVPYAQAAIIFDLVDALGRRDGSIAAQTLHRLLDMGEHPLSLFAMIVRQFRLLIQVKELKIDGANPQEIAKTLSIHPFPARKLHTQASYFTSEQLKAVYHHLLDVDLSIKKGKIDAEVALDLLVAGLAVSQ
jgi:DNA polymerase-3 subunit delta